MMTRSLFAATLGAVLVACSGEGGSGTTGSSGGSGGSTASSSSAGGTGGTGGSASSSGTGGTGGSASSSSSGTGGGGGTAIGPGPYIVSYTTVGPGIDTRVSVTATFMGPEITGYDAGAQEHPTRGTTITAEPGMDAFVAWGRWTNGTSAGVYYANPGQMLSATQGWHLVLGTATPPASMPASGSANYTLIGATLPTIDDGSLQLGTFTGTMSVAFAGASTKIGVDLSVDMPGDATYAIATTGGTGTPATSEIGTFGQMTAVRIGGQVPVTSAGKACTGGASCKASFQGFIAGPDADRVALALVMSAGMFGTQVRAVAVFARQ